MTDTLTPFAHRPGADDDEPVRDAAPTVGPAGRGAAKTPPTADIQPPVGKGAATKPGAGPAVGTAKGPAAKGPAGPGPRPMPKPVPRPAAKAGVVAAPGAAANAVSKADPKPAARPAKPAPRARAKRSRFGTISFVLVFLIPTALVAFYYAAIAADQYRVEVRFAVRGADSGGVLSSFGLSALPGSTNESADSYVIADYIDSVQIIEDIRRYEGVDLRQFFARPIVDFVHRIDPATPVAKFLDTWQWRTDVEYNSITGNTTFEIYAFTPEDARSIAALVLGQSERIVNELSRGAREALISNAQQEVNRTQERLREASATKIAFQQNNTVIDIESPVALENTILTQLESELANLQTRRRTLLSSVNASSPPVRLLDQQIASVETQIARQRANISGSAGGEGNLAETVGRLTDLLLEEEFARTAYTAALEALETAEADARKQERYLATFVAPTAPDVSLHPRPLLYTLVGAFWFLICWALVVFVTRSVRDHAI